MASIALADDHVLLRNGLANLVRNFGHEVLFEANNGDEVIKQIKDGQRPDLLLLDINMKITDGYETSPG
jgi:CheY-like chemotaxis protein